MAERITQISMTDLELVKQIGKGGFSTVYEMKWTKEDGEMQVAAKRLNKPDDDRELNILSKLEHPNIVKLLGVVDEGINFLLILELCEGGALRTFLDNQNGEPLPIEKFYDYAHQAAVPIEYLKKNHIVHKDVKSPNYLITREKTLKLADFGLAKNMDSTISNATVTVSYPWMAPELYKGMILSPTYDIFALAVVIWELWTSQFPFKGLEPHVIAWRVCNNERLPIPANMPLPLADLLRRCWDADWHKRPSIEEIISVITTTSTTIAGPPSARIAAFQEATQSHLINGPWVLEKRFGLDGPGELGFVWGIVANANGDVAVADNTAQVKIFNRGGLYKGSMEGIESSPDGICVSLDGGTYFVTNKTEYTKMYDVNGRFKGQWISSYPQISSSQSHTPRLMGLAMDGKNQVLVGDIESMYINRHTQDGNHIASIKVDIAPEHLAVTPQDNIIVAELYKPPQVVSNTGQVLHILKHPTYGLKWNPRGAYCFKDVIFFTNNVNEQLLEKEIVCYSLSGVYLGNIPIKDANLSSLQITPDGTKLIVGFGFNGCATFV